MNDASIRDMTAERQHRPIGNTRIDGFPQSVDWWRRAEYHDNAFKKGATPASAVVAGSGQSKSELSLGATARTPPVSWSTRASLAIRAAPPQTEHRCTLHHSHRHGQSAAWLAWQKDALHPLRPPHHQHQLCASPSSSAPQRAADARRQIRDGSGRGPKSTAVHLHSPPRRAPLRERRRRGGSRRRTARGAAPAAAPAAARRRAPPVPPQPPQGRSPPRNTNPLRLRLWARRHRGPRQRQRRQRSCRGGAGLWRR